MPMPTSDLRQPVCVELACLQRHPAPRALPEATPNSLDSPGQFQISHYICILHFNIALLGPIRQINEKNSNVAYFYKTEVICNV